MDTALIIGGSVLLSVVSSVAVVRVLDLKKRNGFRKERCVPKESDNIIHIEELANRIVDRERRLNGTTIR